MIWRDIANRLFGAVIVIFLASLLSWLLLALAPGDAAEIVAGETATAEDVERVREELGLNRPFIVQYLAWVGGLLQGDAGFSFLTGRPVVTSLAEAVPATLSLTLVTVVFALIVGVGLGAAAGYRRGSVVDRLATLLATLGLAMPSFWVGLILVSAFALAVPIFPATGYVPLDSGVVRWLTHLVLPATALGVAAAAEIARQTRSGVSDVMDQPFIRTARAKGIGGGPLLRRHVARNAAIPVVTVLGLQIANLLGGVIVVEAVFGIPGLGNLAVESVLARDIPLVQGYILLIATIVVFINLIVDFSYRLIDPKVRA